MARSGWCTVVKGGQTISETGVSSKPTIESCSGTARPLALAAWSMSIARKSVAAITAVEVGVSYIKRLGAGGPPILLSLAAIKFAMVAAYFMHLKFDHSWLRKLFVTGIVLAAIIYAIVFLMFGVFQNRIHS